MRVFERTRARLDHRRDSGSFARVRVLVVAPSENPQVRHLITTFDSLGWTTQAVDARSVSWPWAARFALNTAKAVVRFRPDVALLLGAEAAAAAAVLAPLSIPYVVLANKKSPACGAQKPDVGLMLRRAHAVIVPRWRDGRILADRYGSLSVVTVVDGLSLGNQPRGDKAEALKALGLFPQQRMAGVIGSLGDHTRLDLLAGSYRAIAGLGIFVAGDGPGLDLINAMTVAARPSSPVVAVGPRSPAVDLTTACASTVGLDLEASGPGDGILVFLAQGRRVVTIAGEDATPLLDLFAPELRAVHVARPTEDGVRDGLAAVLEAESTLGPLPAAAVEQARYLLDADTWPRRIADVLQACV